MRKIYLIAGMWAALFSAKAQQVATFEEIDLQPGSYYNGSDGAGGFFSGGIWFPNNYNTDWGSWSGFSVSNMPDTLTAGYGNQYSAITAGGADSSENYAVVYVSGEFKMELNDPAEVEGFFVTNAVYPYLSMRDGDDFTKKFGGPGGNDPDYFLLQVSGIDADGNPTDTVDFYLADFRSDNLDEDYIVNEWMWLDLSALGVVKELTYNLKSSDKGEWGMNTPAYFCIDNFTTADIASSAGSFPGNKPEAGVYPNPVSDDFQVVVNRDADKIILTDQMGRIIYHALVAGRNQISISALNNMPSGVYFLRIYTNKGTISKKIMKY